MNKSLEMQAERTKRHQEQMDAERVKRRQEEIDNDAVYACVFIHYMPLDITIERSTPKLPDGWTYDGEKLYTDQSIEFFRRYPATGSYMGPRSSALEAREAVTDAAENDIESGAIEKYTFHTRAQFEVEYEEWKIQNGNKIEDDIFDYFFRGVTGTVNSPTNVPLLSVVMITHTMVCLRRSKPSMILVSSFFVDLLKSWI
jgi:hypothetical protein